MQFSLKLLLLFGANIAFAQAPRQGTYCEQFNDETTCRENSCAFFGGQGSCESLCSVHEDTWAFIEEIESHAAFSSEENCMMRCLNTPDCTVYSIYNGACRIGSAIDESIGLQFVYVPGAFFGECVKRSSEVQMPTTDDPTLLPSQSPFITSSLACQEFKEETTCRENGCTFFAESGSCEFLESTATPTSEHPSEMPIRSTTTDYQTTAPTYDSPDAEFLNSMGSLLERDPSAVRFVKVGRRAADILRQKKLGHVLHPDVRSAMRTIKNLMKRGFTQSRWNKMVTRYQTVRDLGY